MLDASARGGDFLQRMRALFGAVLVAAVGVLAAPPPATAAPNPATSRFRSLTDVDGLSQMSALAITQDRLGMLWIGTQIGLNRYDGSAIEVFTRRPGQANGEGLSDQYINQLAVDHDGLLWIGTLNGLDRFDPATEQFHSWRADAGRAHALPHPHINAILVDADGVVWIGSDGGLSRYRRNDDGFDSWIEGLPDINVLALVEGDDGMLWVGTAAGLVKFDRRSGTLQPLPEALRSDTRVAVQALARDTAGRLLVGTRDQGLWRLETEGTLTRWRHRNEDPDSLAHDRVYAIRSDRSGTVWLGTEAGADLVDEHDGRVAFRHFQHRSQFVNGIGAGRVVSLFEDQAGDFWFGTWSGGASLLAGERSRFLSFDVGTIDPNATDAAEVVTLASAGGERVWLGTRRGLFRFDADRATIAAEEATRGMRVYALAADDANLLLGTDQGVFRFDPVAQRVTPVALPETLGRPYVDFISVDRDRIWIATRDAQLFVLDRALDRLLVAHRLDTRAHFIADFDGRRKIFGTDKGLYWFANDGNGPVARLQAQPDDPRGLQSDTCHGFLRDSKSRLWLATAGGLHLMQLADSERPGEASFVQYPRGSSANANALKSIFEDASGKLWMSSNAGIARFDPERHEFINFGGADGAIDRGYYAFVATRTASGRILFGGASGFTVFNPAEIGALPVPATPLITALEVDHRNLRYGSSEAEGLLRAPILRTSALKLPSNRARNLAFSFASPSFVAPEQLSYAYRLDGFNDEWIETDAHRRSATYTNLAPGSYAFRVRVRNADGGWAPAEARLALTIEPLWWQSTWLRALGLIALVGVVALFFSARLRLLERQRTRLAAEVADRTADIREAHRQLEDAYHRIELLSRTDELTGLGNRRSLQGALPDLQERHRLGRLGFFLLDVDRFKSINDDYGHGVGDELLALIGRELAAHAGPDALAVRWGGEEFLLVAPVADVDAALAFAERLRKALTARCLALPGGRELSVGLCIGFALSPLSEHADSAVTMASWQRVLDLADYALYAAKRSGRNRVCGLRAVAALPADFEARFRAAPDALLDDGVLGFVSIDPILRTVAA